jgi:hypothetical protein
MTEAEAYGQAYMNGLEKGKRMTVNRILSELAVMEAKSSVYEAAVIRNISEMIGRMENG